MPQVLTVTPNQGESDEDFAARIVEELHAFDAAQGGAPDGTTDVSADAPAAPEEPPPPE
jgi:hypothetical protein